MTASPAPQSVDFATVGQPRPAVVSEIDPGSATRRYERFRSRGIEAHERGSLHDAQTHFRNALVAAQELQDSEIVDRAICNCAAVEISLGATQDAGRQLRPILMSGGSLENCFLAAYNLARCHELAKEPKKSLFYARIARDRARDLDRVEWSYGALNQIANALAAESHFDQASERYQKALALLPSNDQNRGLEARINLGYCRLMQGDREEGLRTLYRGLRESRQTDQPRLEMIVRLDLAFGTLESGRPDLSLRHVRRGLFLAETRGDRDALKNGLYLEGEIWTDLSRDAEAHQARLDLQRRFYPDQPEIAQYLMAINSRQLINLRA